MQAQATQTTQTQKALVHTILQNTDWNGYWREVDRNAAKEADAYAAARRQSRNISAHRVLR